MFDAETSALIAGAPHLEGLDLGRLPEQFTASYASIVAARIRLRSIAADERVPSAIDGVAAQMRKLAYVNEAFVSAAPGRDNRVSAAFVAGAAHHVSLMARRLKNRDRSPSRLEFNAIPPEVSATLLFMIAEAPADAAEMAKEIQDTPEDPIEGAVLKAIVNLSRGELTAIQNRSEPAFNPAPSADPADQAASALYYLLLRGIRQLASELLGDTSPAGNPAAALFRRAKEMSVEGIDLEEPLSRVFSVFPGPHHLATLLTSVADNLPGTAIVNVSPPAGLDGAAWLSMMRNIAKRRPYLWRNHRDAIASGYLDTGTSSAVSFPTGAGKSSLSELKIAAALLAGRKIVFLAPTLALVEQTAASLRNTFPQAAVQRERAEGFAFDDFVGELPEVSVMTPEKCLVLLGYEPETFSDVGLLVFDECHLMHADELQVSHRALDAMLCVLNFVNASPSADLLLLSAMMKNTKEIAGWIEAVTGRRCLALDLTWKPTRQVRGCVVHEASRIEELNSTLRSTRMTSKTKTVPAATARTLTAEPLGLFSLRQTWVSAAREHYSLLHLLDEPIALSTGTSRAGSWYLTPNGNKLASALAAGAARQSLKTLVFVQTIPLATSATKEVNSRTASGEILLTPAERILLTQAVEELGGASYLYLTVKGEDRVECACVSHHSLLLPPERRLHESLFKRQDGARVMVATSTLAQGMNLPAEIVIIGGDSRFDREANQVERLEAHELLNAAGRAGRAGESAYGFVLLVPSKIIHFRDGKNEIGKHWVDLQTIFAQSDQCLEIDDPITSLLDHLQSAGDDQPAVVKYFLSRLPVGEESDKDAPARELLSKSLAAYRKKRANDQEWIEQRISRALDLRRRDASPSNPSWVERLGSATGVPGPLLASLGGALQGVNLPSNGTVVQWRDWFFAWLTANPHFLPQLIRPATLDSVLAKGYKGLTDDAARGQFILAYASTPLSLWMAGAPLTEISTGCGTPPEKMGKCEASRDFVIRLVPELAFAFGLPLQVIRAIKKGSIEEDQVPGLGLEALSACVRGGFDDAEKLALAQASSGRYSRVAVHRRYASLGSALPPPLAGEDLGDAVRRLKSVL